MSQPKQMPIPAQVVISGQPAGELSQYIQNNPCPNAPVAVALKLCGWIEMALQAAAENGVSKHPDGSDVLAQASALAERQAQEGAAGT